MVDGRRLVGLLLTAVLVSVLASCTSTPSPARVRAEIAKTPAKNLSSYSFDPAEPLTERVQEAPAFFLDYLRTMDHNDAYAVYRPSDQEKRLIGSTIMLLPKAYRQVLADRLVAIYFISNFTGSGLADYVLDSSDRIYATLVLNPEVLKHNLSDWLSYRESTCYEGGRAGDERIEVRVDCGTRYSGLLYILLHESSHIVDYVRHFTPYTEPSLAILGLRVSRTSFTMPVWESYATPQSTYDFPLRKQIHFYGLGTRVHRSEALELYRNLGASPFVSLYGSMTWAEDFAEYMTMYYLTQVLHQPYVIQVFQDGVLRYSLEPMKSQKVLARAAAVSSLLE